MNDNKIVLFSPEQKLILGLFFIPAYLLQESIYIRTIQFFLLIFVFILSGRKFRIIPNLILLTGIVTAYLLNPVGKVIFMAGNFPVTQGALVSGLVRALMLIGLIYISRLSISSKLNFNGKTGNLIGRVFYYFEAITEGQGNFSFRNFYKPGVIDRFIKYIDNLLLFVETNSFKNELKIECKKNKLSKLVSILIFTFILASYILLLPLFDMK